MTHILVVLSFKQFLVFFLIAGLFLNHCDCFKLVTEALKKEIGEMHGIRQAGNHFLISKIGE